ncbi:DNA mismatch repair protein Msh3-like [Chenopodium quinoa]|uniref:DNA mismatch repair protein Msh3-like n=1 Tax=Chenopodium quinoa TaxID=63459 RepID=UPI000B791BBB|nr:DNA mismatch repair protein Msh3-like [Chenopodium quinoa]
MDDFPEPASQEDVRVLIWSMWEGSSLLREALKVAKKQLEELQKKCDKVNDNADDDKDDDENDIENDDEEDDQMQIKMAKRTKKKQDPPKDIASPKKAAANKKVTAAKKTLAPKKSPAAKKSPTSKKVPANTKQSPIKGAKLQRISKKQILIKRRIKELEASKGTKKRVKSELKDSNYEPEEDQNENSDGSSEEDRKKGQGHLKKKLKLDNSEHDVDEFIDINDDNDGNLEIKKTHYRPNAVVDLIKDFSEQHKKDVKKWKKKLGILEDDEIIVNNLETKLKTLKEGGEDFKRFFVMYVCSTFLAHVANRVIDYKIINYVDNVKEIHNLDWCGYVMNNLCKSVRSFKNNKNKDSRSGISGCVLIIQLVYFYHLAFRGQPEPITLPLIQHWTDEKVKERIAKKAKASFGQGELQKNDYLVCRKKGKEAFLGDVIENAYRNFSDREKRLVSFNLPEDVMTNSDMKLQKM